MDTYVVTINESKHDGSALELFREALRRAPNQLRWVRHSNNKEAGFMLPHCSVDAEFVKMERDATEREEQGWGARNGVHEGTLEELCSVLTFAVGRHFFLVFNLVHMLEASDKLTVSALTNLFRHTIFDKNLLKLWWNNQSDIAVLDGTVAHMFQQTAREPYHHNPYGTDKDHLITPRWRIKRNHFQGARPDDLKFPKEDIECELHRYGGNEQGIACCCRLGNVDISSLFTHFGEMHGMARSAYVKKLPWWDHRHNFNYGNLLHCMLESDRVYPLLDWMKIRPSRAGKPRDAFYQDMGRPEMVLEDGVMAYNIGDVAGQNMIFEQLLTSDDKHFVAGCLSRYGQSYCGGSDERSIPQRPSKLGSIGGVQLWEDNPRSFEDTSFDFDPNNPCWPKAELYMTDSLTPWEHDRRVQLMRAKSAIALANDETHPSGAYVLPEEAHATVKALRRDILTSMHDPTRLAVSRDCARSVDAVYESPIVRAGTTHSEALVHFLRSTLADVDQPPPGFGAAPGDSNGLPGWFKRVPGQGLDQARNICKAFKQHDKKAIGRLGKRQAMPQNSGWLVEDLDPNKLFEQILEAYTNDLRAEGNMWSMVELAKDEAGRALNKELEKTADHGLPYSLNTHDFFDLEGREYRQRVEQAQAWNRPELEHNFSLTKDGTLKSLASTQLEVIKKKLPDGEWFEPVTKKHKRREF